ncbi:MAG: tRNA (adenosine(37)-N6)-dimethylallyltransferase, partial [Alphaproteobacteria bacterium]
MTTPSSNAPIMICGPTASGKSALAMRLAKLTNGYIVNADALQVYDHWRVLTARPSVEDENQTLHRLYGHVNARETYSVGAWLREVKALMSKTAARPIFVGGTGLYFSALTNGLAEIPETPDNVR